jgi:medium-chain acyl-[acyl-carrier-protein] hydrolase
MASSWIAYRLPKPHARVRLLCFPYAGSGASMYRKWVEEAPPDLDVCPVQLPGREGRCHETPYSTLEPLLDVLCDELAPWTDAPFALFGCSMGAIVAAELADALQRRAGKTAAHLFVAARRAPGRPDSRPPTAGLSNAEFLAQLREYNGTPSELLDDPDAMAFYLPCLRADFALCERFVPRPGATIDCPLTVLGGTEDADVSPDDLEAWRPVTTSAFASCTFAAGHFFVNTCRDAVLATVVARLRAHRLLDAADGDSELLRRYIA